MQIDVEKVRRYRLDLLESAGLCVEGDLMALPEDEWLKLVARANTIICARREQEKRELDPNSQTNG